MRAVEIIGEAARLVSSKTRSTHPEVPWRQLVGLRHKVAHDYHGVDLAIVWEVVTAELPLLIESLAAILNIEDE